MENHEKENIESKHGLISNGIFIFIAFGIIGFFVGIFFVGIPHFGLMVGLISGFLTWWFKPLSDKVSSWLATDDNKTTSSATSNVTKTSSVENNQPVTPTQTIIVKEESPKPKVPLKQKLDHSKLVCPVCKSANITKNEVNNKEVSKTSLNLNPLHPLTFANTKKKKKAKKSAGKVAMGIATGGTSLMVTGVHKKTTQNRCLNCGHVWTTK